MSEAPDRPAAARGDVEGPPADAERWPLAVFALLLAVVAALVVTYELDPAGAATGWATDDVSRLLGLCSGLTAVGLLIYGGLRRWPWLHAPARVRLLQATLSLWVLGGGVVYFYGMHGLVHRTYVHQWDAYHYLLGPKYFRELGYFDLYRCTAQATPRAVIPDATKARDLRTYEVVTAGALRRDGDCAALFTAARWQEFQGDVAVFGAEEPRRLRRMLLDHGYNGTPVHTAITARVANLFPLRFTTLTLSTLLDPLALCVMLAAITRAFGWRLGLVFALLLFTNVVDRFAIIGASFLRYLWLASLGLAFAALGRGRHRVAGLCFTLAAALNVFPAVFALGLALKAAVELIRTRTLAARYRQLVLAAVVSALALGALGLTTGRGASAYAEFRDDMRVHLRDERIPGFGVGLKYDFVYRGEHEKHTYSRAKKAKELAQARPVYLALAGLFIGLAGLVAARLDDVEAAALVGFTVLFCQLETTGYYFACAATLTLLYHRRAAAPGGLLMLALLFAINALDFYGYLRTHKYFTYNTIVSYSWTLYLALTLAYFGAITGT
ncbi:MAG: hypothetical protein KC636_37090, partial [Myxococcales bacterium]|nr:hypothetical protein [Myxococcales bacterium]